MDSMQKLIVFYDGDCGFCNKSVQFVLKNEKGKKIHFAALQAEFSVQFFKNKGLEQPNMSTFYFWNGKKMLQKSTAALSLLKYLKMPFPLGAFFWIIPSLLRDKVYDFVAKRRHKLAAGFCALPSVEERKRFLN